MSSSQADREIWWPFLLSNGRSVGQRLIMAPPFIIDRNLTRLLIDASALPETMRDRIVYRKVMGSEIGNFTVLYRVTRATGTLIGKSDDQVLIDNSSRPVNLTEGVVCLNDDIEPVVPQSLMDQLHVAAGIAFRVFWEADDPYAATMASKGLAIPERQPPSNFAVAEMVPSIDLHPAMVPDTEEGTSHPGPAGIGHDEPKQIIEPRKGCKGCLGRLGVLLLVALTAIISVIVTVLIIL